MSEISEVVAGQVNERFLEVPTNATYFADLAILNGRQPGAQNPFDSVVREVVDFRSGAESWPSSVFEDSLRPVAYFDAPTLAWSSNFATALSSPVVYKPAIVGTGSQVTNWNGLTSPADSNILWSPGNFYTNGGGNTDIAMYGTNKSGVEGYPWPVIAEFNTSSGVNAIEIGFYQATNQRFPPFIEVNGRPIALNTYNPTQTLTEGRKLTITFPYPGERRIRIWELLGVGEIRVPTGTTISKPTDTIRRRWAALGDSLVNGSGHASTTFPSGALFPETHAAMLFRALGVQQPVMAGVGSTGFTTADGYSTRVSALMGFGLNALVVYGSVNDPQNGAGVQAAAEQVLSSVSSISTVVLVGVPRAGWEQCNVALAAAAAKFPNVHFVPMDAFIYGPGKATDPQIAGNAAYFIGSDGIHPTQLGHRAIASYLFDVISRLVD